MPIYEYVCTACERRTDVIHGIDAPGPSVCEVCGGALRKALSTPAIHFKGSGWAKKDARAAAAPAAGSGAPKEGGSEAASGDGGSAKPADAPATPSPAATPSPVASGSSDTTGG